MTFAFIFGEGLTKYKKFYYWILDELLYTKKPKEKPTFFVFKNNNNLIVNWEGFEF